MQEDNTACNNTVCARRQSHHREKPKSSSLRITFSDVSRVERTNDIVLFSHPLSLSSLSQTPPLAFVTFSRSLTDPPSEASDLYINSLPTTTICSTTAPTTQHSGFPQTSNPVQDSPGIKTWAHNLASLFDSRLNQTNINSFEQNFRLLDPQPLFPLNYQSSHSHPLPNINLPSFWDSNVELWFAAEEHQFFLPMASLMSLSVSLWF